MAPFFITRTYPPAVGGMENLSYNLLRFFPGRKKVLALKKKGKMNLIWFIPYSLIKSLTLTSQVDMLHLSDATLAIVGYIFKKISKKPVLINLHGLDLIYSNRFYQLYLTFFLKGFDGYICNSLATEKLALNVGIQSTVVIPPGIDSNKFKMKRGKDFIKKYISEKYKVDIGNKIILLTVGRLIKRKGVYWFVNKVLSKLPNRVIYIVVGDGPERKRIEYLIFKRRLQDRVFLLGKITDRDLNYAYHLADIFVMPNIKVSGDYEGFGMVAVEASCCSLPIVASACEGIMDSVKEGVNGLLVQPRDSEEFIDKLNYIIKRKEARNNMGKKGREYVLRNYDWRKVIKEYEKNFKEVLNPNFI